MKQQAVQMLGLQQMQQLKPDLLAEYFVLPNPVTL